MSGIDKRARLDALLSTIKVWRAAGAPSSFLQIVLYTSLGVVRGRTTLSLGQEEGELDAGAALGSPEDTIELLDVTVEHYSNHLPTASFDRLHVRLRDVQAFALGGSQNQG